MYNEYMYHLAKKHFKKIDPVLFRAAQKHVIEDIKLSKDVFHDLVHAVVNQQLSGKAADTIFSRLESLIGRGRGSHKKGFVTPSAILKVRTSSMRRCGLSEAKTRTIQGLARAVADGELDLVMLHEHPDEEVIELLTSVKGIGPWTAEMILMFSLGRVDIFSKGDLGLRKGIMKLYGLKKLPSDRQMEKLSRAWKPYRTYAAKVLWRVADESKKH